MPRAKGVTALDTQVGLRLRTMRLASGKSQEWLAKELGISFQQVQKYEKGDNRLSLSRAVDVVGLLGTSIGELLGRGDEEAPLVAFDHHTYQLAQSLTRLQQLAPNLAAKYSALINATCDAIETEPTKPKKKKR